MKRASYIALSLSFLITLSACSTNDKVANPPETTSTIHTSETSDHATTVSEPMSWDERYEAKQEAIKQLEQRYRTEPEIDSAYAAKRTSTSGKIDHSTMDSLLKTWVNSGISKGNCEVWNEAFHPEVRPADCDSDEKLIVEDMSLAGVSYASVDESMDTWRITGNLNGTSQTVQFTIPEPQKFDGKWYLSSPISTAVTAGSLEDARTLADETAGNISPYSKEGYEQGLKPSSDTGAPASSLESQDSSAPDALDHTSKESFVKSWADKALATGECETWNQALSPDLNPVDCTGMSSKWFTNLKESKLGNYVKSSEHGDGITRLEVKISGSSEPEVFSLYDIEKLDGGWYFTAHPALESLSEQAIERREYIDSTQP